MLSKAFLNTPLTRPIVLLFKQTEQPRVYKGNIAASVATALSVGGLLAILFLSKRDGRRKRAFSEEEVTIPGSDTYPGTPEDVETKSLEYGVTRGQKA